MTDQGKKDAAAHAKAAEAEKSKTDAQAAAEAAKAEAAAAEAAKARTQEKPAQPEKWLRSLTKFSYTDPQTNIKYGPVVPIRQTGELKKGSWLWVQMQAKLIG